MVHAGPRGRSVVAVGACFALLQLLAVLNPDTVEVDPEEGYNAAHAFAVANGHLAEVFALQYRPFCGGCTLDALLAAPLFATLGPSWLVWKLVPLGFSLLLLLLGFARLPSPARWCWALLFLLPFPTWLSLSLIGWGNHYEAACLAASGLLLLRAPRRPLWAGLLVGGALWVGFSGLFALPAALLWLLWVDRRALARFLLGVLLGVSPWLAQWMLTQGTPFGEIYGQGEATPALRHLPDQLRTLLHPRQLAGLLGHRWLGLGGLIALPGALLGLGMLHRTRPWGWLVGLSALSWGSIYLLSGFHIPIPEGGVLPEPASLRYMAPLIPLLCFGLSLGAGALWSEGRRASAAALLAGPLLAGAVGRVSVLTAPFPVRQAATMQAPDLRYFQQQASYTLDRTAHRACQSDDPRERAVHGYALGHHKASVAFQGNPSPEHALMGFRPTPGADEGGFYAGAAVALIDHLDPDGQGDLDALTQAIEIAEGWGDAAVQAMLRTRRYAPWLSATEGHDEAALARLQEALAAAPAPVWWLVGLRWGEDTSRPLVPTTVALPSVTPAQEVAIPAAFAEGLGAAMGEQWGPQDPPLPQNLPARWIEPFQSGYHRGAAQRWP